MNEKKVLWNEINMTKLNFYIKYLINIIPKYITNIFYKNMRTNEFYIFCEKQNLYNILMFLKQSTYFQVKSLVDICVVDYPYKKNRFELIYNLVSIRFNTRLFIKTNIANNSFIDSIVNLYNGAN